ncbi:MAG TPA: hypothetical protein VGN17_00430 [Bryobacteraceae bacterium]
MQDRAEMLEDIECTFRNMIADMNTVRDELASVFADHQKTHTEI